MVWAGFLCPVERGDDFFCIFSVIYWKHWKLHKIMEFLKISEKFKHFSEFSDFCIFRAVDPPKPLINDNEYWCFCKPVDFAEIMISIKKAKICEKITFFIFCDNFVKKWFSAKMGPRAPGTPKKGWNCIGFKGPGASGPRGCGKLDFCKFRNIFFTLSMKIWNFT